MFVKLLSISGIGPKLALNILSHISVGELCDALGQKDAKRLSALPGIGRKTAERLVLELSDKVPRTAPSTSGTAATGKNDPLGDALSALVNLGYKETQARKALESMEITVPVQVTLEEILKGALKILVR
jgi:holliday junction DNA helicase RuvA